MRTGDPKKIKNHQYRVGVVPTSGRELVQNGRTLTVEKT